MKKFASRKAGVVLSLALATAVCFTSATNVEAASKKYVKSLKVSKTSVSLTEGQKATVNATVAVKGSAPKKVTVKSSNASIAAVKAGKASKKGVSTVTITAKKAGTATITVKTTGKNSKKKQLSKAIKVTVKGKTSVNPSTKPSVNPSSNPGTQPSNNPGTKPSSNPGTKPSSNPGTPSTQPSNAPSVSTGFTKADYTVKYEVVHKMVDFTINTETTSKEELAAQGYTISEDGKSASKDNALLKATYTFKKLPTSLSELQQFDIKSEMVTVDGIEYDAGMLKPMAANILAIHTGKFANRLATSSELGDMLDYLEGPNLKLSAQRKQLVHGQILDHPEVRNCYFVGATPSNSYTPSQPYTIVVEEGPYYIPAKTTINGKRPETHMAFVYFAGADTGRYLDVFKSSDGNWYTWEDNCLHLTASVKEAEIEW